MAIVTFDQYQHQLYEINRLRGLNHQLMENNQHLNAENRAMKDRVAVVNAECEHLRQRLEKDPRNVDLALRLQEKGQQYNELLEECATLKRSPAYAKPFFELLAKIDSIEAQNQQLEQELAISKSRERGALRNRVRPNAKLIAPRPRNLYKPVSPIDPTKLKEEARTYKAAMDKAIEESIQKETQIKSLSERVTQLEGLNARLSQRVLSLAVEVTSQRVMDPYTINGACSI